MKVIVSESQNKIRALEEMLSKEVMVNKNNFKMITHCRKKRLVIHLMGFDIQQHRW